MGAWIGRQQRNLDNANGLKMIGQMDLLMHRRPLPQPRNQTLRDWRYEHANEARPRAALLRALPLRREDEAVDGGGKESRFGGLYIVDGFGLW